MPRRTVAIIVAFLSCGGGFDTSEKVAVVGHGAKTFGRSAVAGSTGDFRNQIAFAARTIAPSVVAIRAAQPLVLESPPTVDNPYRADDHRELPAAPAREPSAEERSLGSGVVLDAKGHILITNHQIAGVEQIRIVLADDRELDATLVATDAEKDLAVLRIDAAAARLRAAALGNSDRLQLGEWVVSCGNALGRRPTVSAGIVSALSQPRASGTDQIGLMQTDARIDAAAVGGPLVNLSGHVIGINTAAASDGKSIAGAGFVIPINNAKQLLGQALARGKPTQDVAGLFIDDLNAALAASFRYGGSGGVLVHDVAADGPAARAGVVPGDIVVALDGRPIASAAALRDAIARRQTGAALQLAIWREGARVTAELGPAASPDADDASREGAPSASAGWGLELSELSEKLRERANLGALEGALVVRVEPQSAADKAGIQRDDVIVSVNGKHVQEATAARTLLDETSGPVRLQIVRDGPTRFVMMTQRTAR